jgi:hypothetical protein
MRFHYGPFRAKVVVDPTSTYPIPKCRHVDNKPTPPNTYQLSVTFGPVPADAIGMRASMEGWTAELGVSEGTVYLHPASPPDLAYFDELFAAVGIGRALLDGGFVLHASSILAGGSAFLFAGLSGTGKSTIARLLGPGRRIADDQSMLLPSGDSWWCCSTFLLEHEGALPGRIFLIEQAARSELESLPLQRALPMVMRHLVLWQGDAKAHALVLNNLSRFLEKVPCYRLAVGLGDISLKQLFAEVP